MQEFFGQEETGLSLVDIHPIVRTEAQEVTLVEAGHCLAETKDIIRKAYSHEQTGPCLVEIHPIVIAEPQDGTRVKAGHCLAETKVIAMKAYYHEQTGPCLVEIYTNVTPDTQEVFFFAMKELGFAWLRSIQS